MKKVLLGLGLALAGAQGVQAADSGVQVPNGALAMQWLEKAVETHAQAVSFAEWNLQMLQERFECACKNNMLDDTSYSIFTGYIQEAKQVAWWAQYDLTRAQLRRDRARQRCLKQSKDPSSK